MRVGSELLMGSATHQLAAAAAVHDPALMAVWSPSLVEDLIPLFGRLALQAMESQQIVAALSRFGGKNVYTCNSDLCCWREGQRQAVVSDDRPLCEDSEGFGARAPSGKRGRAFHAMWLQRLAQWRQRGWGFQYYGVVYWCNCKQGLDHLEHRLGLAIQQCQSA